MWLSLDMEGMYTFEDTKFLWQLSQNAVLTRDVMKQRGWKKNPRCSFCAEKETSQHLFFTCPVARVTWRVVACMFGTDLCPNNIKQAYSWCHSFFPEGEVFHTVGIAAICWAIWTCRNRATFEFIPLKNPSECAFSTCALLCYWAGRMKQQKDVDDLRTGAAMLKNNASRLMQICARRTRKVELGEVRDQKEA